MSSARYPKRLSVPVSQEWLAAVTKAAARQTLETGERVTVCEFVRAAVEAQLHSPPVDGRERRKGR